jgi:prepilin-type N-terminal cleavage/methylation domain-containing protein/prepilin-type processing-associated H-X9-DG protein
MHRDGYTLVEILVAIGVIAVLLGILIPTLASVRAAARATECASNLRGIGVMYEMYAADHDRRWPVYPFTPGPDGVVSEMYRIAPGWGTYPDPAYSGTYAFPYTQVVLWAHPLQPYASDEPLDAPFNAVRAVTCPAVYNLFADRAKQGFVVVGSLAGASYYHPFAFFTRPEAWTQGPGVPVHINAFHGAPRLSDVRFPSNRASLIEAASYHAGRVTPLERAHAETFNALAADGHVSRRAPRDARPAVPTSGATALFPSPFRHEPVPFLSTQGGLQAPDW